MTADLGLVVHAPQAHSHELAPGRPGDALAERGLANAGRTDEAKDRALARRIELAHREVLEDAPLDLVEPVMVVIEDAACLRDVDLGCRVGGPGQLDQPFEIRAHHRILAGAFGHALQALQLLSRVLFHFVGHLGFGDGRLQFGDLRRALVTFTQLLLDRAHLLAQQVLAIHVANRLLGALVDFARDLEHFDAARQELEQLVQPRLEVEGFQQRLLFLGTDVHQTGDQVREARGTLDALQRDDHLFGDLRQQLQDFDRTLLQVVGAAFDIRVGPIGLVDELDACDGKRIALQKLQHAEALQTLADRVMQPVGGRDVTQYVRGCANPVQIFGARLFDVGLALEKDAERALKPHGFLRRRARALSAHGERQDHAWKQDDVAHRQHDHGVFGQRAARAFAPRLSRGCGDLDAGARVGADRQARGSLFVHGCPIQPILRSLKIRHPFSNSCLAPSRRPPGRGMRRSKYP